MSARVPRSRHLALEMHGYQFKNLSLIVVRRVLRAGVARNREIANFRDAAARETSWFQALTDGIRIAPSNRYEEGGSHDDE